MRYSLGGVTGRLGLDKAKHTDLDRFSHAYSTATDTTLRRAVLDVLRRINLAYLYRVCLESLEALSHSSLQQKALGSGGSDV